MVAPKLALGVALLACAGQADAMKWALSETYDSTNFLSKFNFFESSDPGHGHVSYQSQANALKKGLVAIQNGEVRLGADHTTILRGQNYPGRPSVRVESKNQYNHGLFIGRFTHLPEAKCGVWPAFWTYGNHWPYDGEVDIYEAWNEASYNQPALHSFDSAHLGQCLIDGKDMSGSLVTANCDNGYQNPPTQYLNQGCAVTDPTQGVWGSSTGGVVAMEWTRDYIKLYSWPWSSVPANVATSQPDTSTWGTPSAFLKTSQCNIDKHFANQRLVLNIDFCGDPAGFDSEWSKTCKAKTGQATCVDFVSKFPAKFANSYFTIKDIRVFKAAV